MTEADKLRQERDQWENEALRLREQLFAASERADIFRRGAEVYSKSVDELTAENEALRKRLDSACMFHFGDFWVERPSTFPSKWGVRESFGSCLICNRRKSRHDRKAGECYFDTVEEAEAAARKALEVAG